VPEIIMGIYYFNIRDQFGLIEDKDGMELPDRMALLLEVIRSADEFLKDSTTPHEMRFEITDIEGRTILMTPVQQSSASWDYLASLSIARGNTH
jgi:hypothetical protein